MFAADHGMSVEQNPRHKSRGKPYLRRWQHPCPVRKTTYAILVVRSALTDVAYSCQCHERSAAAAAVATTSTQEPVSFCSPQSLSHHQVMQMQSARAQIQAGSRCVQQPLAGTRCVCNAVKLNLQSQQRSSCCSSEHMHEVTVAPTLESVIEHVIAWYVCTDQAPIVQANNSRSPSFLLPGVAAVMCALGEQHQPVRQQCRACCQMSSCIRAAILLCYEQGSLSASKFCKHWLPS